MLKQIMICIVIGYMAAATGFAEGLQDKAQIHLSDKTMRQYQIKLAKAGPKTLEMTRDVLGKIVPNANKTLYIYPRYSGIIKRMTKFLGDKVRQGELLATVESNQTLQTYEVNAPFSGYIVRKTANPGEFVKTGSSIYQLADLSNVWVHLFIFRKDAELIKKGQAVQVYDKNDPARKTGSEIDYVSPMGIEKNQTMMARAVINNPDNELTWLPGLYVNVRVIIQSKPVAVAVKNSAIQTVDGQAVVFVKVKDGFEPRVCQTGMEGQAYTEIKSGLKNGDIYVEDNSFLLKAELEKDTMEEAR